MPRTQAIWSECQRGTRQADGRDEGTYLLGSIPRDILMAKSGKKKADILRQLPLLRSARRNLPICLGVVRLVVRRFGQLRGAAQGMPPPQFAGRSTRRGCVAAADADRQAACPQRQRGIDGGAHPETTRRPRVSPPPIVPGHRQMRPPVVPPVHDTMSVKSPSQESREGATIQEVDTTG